MKKRFKSSQIKNGEADYTLEEFLGDLWESVKTTVSKSDFDNLPEGEERDREYNKAVRDLFHFVYEICYLAAIKTPYLKIILERAKNSEKEIINKTIKEYKDNTKMLRTIFMNQITKKLNNGLTKKQATKALIEHSKELILNWDKKEHLNKQAKNNSLEEE